MARTVYSGLSSGGTSLVAFLFALAEQQGW